MDDFYRTVMGRKFFERDVPELVRHLARIADALEHLQIPAPAPAATPVDAKDAK